MIPEHFNLNVSLHFGAFCSATVGIIHQFINRNQHVGHCTTLFVSCSHPQQILSTRVSVLLTKLSLLAKFSTSCVLQLQTVFRIKNA